MRISPALSKALRTIAMIVAIAALAARFLYPAADFPAHSRWIGEPGRYTDEGWYAAAAVHHAISGRWLLPGDFNPAVTVPLWPAMLAAVFHFTGVSMAAARLLSICFGVILVLLCTALYKRSRPQHAWIVFLLLSTCATLAVFSRLALLETPMAAFFVAALLVAPRTTEKTALHIVAASLLFVCSILVKSSVVFLFPALLYYVWWENRGEAPKKRFGNVLWIAALTGGLLLVYAVVVVVPHYSAYQALLGQNRLSVNRHAPFKTIRIFYRNFTWGAPVLFPFAVLAAVAGAYRASLRATPLYGLSILWFAGYAAFSVMHYEADPRYFVMFLPPTIFLAVLLWEEFAARTLWSQIGYAVFLLVVVANLATSARYLLQRQYTFRDAADHVRAIVLASGDPHPLLFGHGAEETSLFTRIDALDDMGSLPLGQKLDVYHPGWLLTWSDAENIETDPAITARYSLQKAGDWSVMDQPDRSRLLLFRLEPLERSTYAAGR